MSKELSLLLAGLFVVIIAGIMAPPPGSSTAFLPVKSSSKSYQASAKSTASETKNSCTWNGITLHGKVQFVDSFPDIKIKYVSSFADINVQFVSSFPDDCGQWQEVSSFPDFTVQIVDSFPDLEVKKVSSFPGMN